MKRRSLLKSAVTGSVAAVAGCQRMDTGTQSSEQRANVTYRYPWFQTNYLTTVQRSTKVQPSPETERTPLQFDELPATARFEFANAVHRDGFRSRRGPTLLRDDIDYENVEYRGTVFDIGVGVADRFREPEHGPDGDPEWTDPVAIDPRSTDGELTVTITNELGFEVDFHHEGQPYFGVLTAVGDTSAVLGHDQYEANEFIRTDDIVQTEDVPRDQQDTKTLAAGETVEDSYRIPERLSGEAKIWVPIWLGGESVDVFGNRRTLVSATISIEL